MNYCKVIAVGDEIVHNDMINSYLREFLSENRVEIEALYNYKIDNKKIFLVLEQLLNSSDETILIVADTTLAFITISNLLIAITKDSKKSVMDMIIPSKASKCEKNSYLLEYGSNIINVLNCNFYSGESAKILLDMKYDRVTLNIFDTSIDKLSEVITKFRDNESIVLNAYYQTDEWIVLKATSDNSKLLSSLEDELTMNNISYINGENIAINIIKKLSEHGKKVVSAESCSGGLIAEFFTKCSGASDVFMGSAVTYHNEAKSAWLGVNVETLAKYGAVSKETVSQMLAGALSITPKANYALAVSGIAGPSGGTINKPVGTVIIGAKSKDNEIVRVFNFSGDRVIVQQKAKYQAIKMLLELDSKIFF